MSRISFCFIPKLIKNLPVLPSICTLALILFAFQTQAASSTKFYCEYFIYSAPFIQVEMILQENGKWHPYARVFHYGQEKEETLDQENPSGNEKYRLSLAKGDPDQTLFIEIYEDLNSNLINPQASFGKVVAGTCKISSVANVDLEGSTRPTEF